MADELRVRQMLEDLLESGRTPEAVCADHPELLSDVRRRLDQIRGVERELDEIFPTPVPTKHDGRVASDAGERLPPLDGHDVEGVLGRGGMGVVYRARHRALNRPVAVKMLLAGAYAGPTELGRFQREAKAVAALRHPNIVQVHDAGDVEGRPYFTMELVEGGNLAPQLAGTPQPVRRAAELVAILAGAVQFAHRSGIIHRDLKPANILLTADGTPKITDFGLALPIGGGDRFTLTGARVGTPCYMAPEQAAGKAAAIGPAVDIYALGAILYELLTGRPPFVGETPSETERKVIADEPEAPSRLNGQVPRDLETVCLKCLQKNPARRYASAQDLADDLHRFLDGKPVIARPVGIVERTVKWAHRRPTLATLLAVLLGLLGVAIGVSIWLRQQDNTRRVETAHRQDRARQAVESALDRAYKFAEAERWLESRSSLTEATSHLANAESAELVSRAALAERDVQFARKLEGIRQRAASLMSENFAFSANSVLNVQSDEYREAFAQAGLDVFGDAEGAAARIRASPLGEQTIVALDRLAFAEFKLGSGSDCERVLHVARLADPDPTWRDRFRNQRFWRDKQELLHLAFDAPTASRPLTAHHLAIIAALLRDQSAGPEGTRLLREALGRRRGDFWLNWEMGDILRQEKRSADAATYFRIAVGLRPDNPRAISCLGAALIEAGEYEEGIAQYRRAIELAPNEWALIHDFAVMLISAGRPLDAIAECRKAVAANPTNGTMNLTLGRAFSIIGRHEEAIPAYRRAVELNGLGNLSYLYLGGALGWCGRYEESEGNFRKVIALSPGSINGHLSLGQTLRHLHRHAEAVPELDWVIREFDRAKKLSGESGGDSYDLAHFELAESLLCLRQFAEAITAAERALQLPNVQKWGGRTLRRQIEIGRRLDPLATALPAILEGRELPADVTAQRDLAEWCYQYGRLLATAARLYDDVFAKQPSLAEDLLTEDRFHAACAAALAGCGLGDDAAKLTDPERTALRKKSAEWLQAHRDAWVKRQASGKPGDPEAAIQALRSWQGNTDLATVRDPVALARLPEAEHKQWQAFWADVEASISRSPRVRVERARALAARKQWTKAAEAYGQLIREVRVLDSDVWFEFAAVRLLAGDRNGFLETCEQMHRNKMRPYLVARAWTLAPDLGPQLTAAEIAWREELLQYAITFWSLTQQGALACRNQRQKNVLLDPRRGVPYFEQSLKADYRPGTAVVNWLWLALAHEKLGDTAKARYWLERGTAWLEGLGAELPSDAEARWGWHIHNWLEAHVLRREAEARVRPPLLQNGDARRRDHHHAD